MAYKPKILPVSEGGTGVSTLGDAGVLIGNGTGTMQATSAGTSGQVLTSNGAGVDPTFQAPGSIGSSFIPSYVLTGILAGSAMRTFHIDSSDTVISILSTNVYNWTRSSATATNFAIARTAASSDGAADSTLYTDSGTKLFFKKTAANTFRQSAVDGSSANDITISGTAPGSFSAGVTWDAANSRLLVLEGAASTQIRRYTISGTTITNIASDLTLSAAPTSSRAMFYDGTNIWIYDLAAGGPVLLKYNSTGTFISTTLFTVAGNHEPRVGQKFDSTSFYMSANTDDSSTGTSGILYKVNF